mgnify:CR=1 FL=1
MSLLSIRLVGLLSLALAWPCSAQVAVPEVAPPAEAPQVTPAMGGQNGGVLVPYIEQQGGLHPVESHAVPSEVQAAFDKYQVQYYAFLGHQTEVAIENFRWQQRASEVLMWTVLAVVFCGLAFSGYQLYHATRLGKDIGANEIEIGADKVRITSSIVGLAVLFMSIAFLYLFLIEVYRIKPVNMLQQPPAAAQQGGSSTAK